MEISPCNKNDIQADAFIIGMNEIYKSEEVAPIIVGIKAIAINKTVRGPR